MANTSSSDFAEKASLFMGTNTKNKEDANNGKGENGVLSGNGRGGPEEF